MALGTSLMQGDVLIITFSHTNRLKLYYYHQETEFKEIKNLPIVKNITQLQPIIFQFIEDFLRSRIEVAFEKQGFIFNPDKLTGNILLITDSNLPEAFSNEVEDLFSWLVNTLRLNEFHKVMVEKSIKNKETNKTEKISELLYADYQLSISKINTFFPDKLKSENLVKSGSIDFKKSVFAQLVTNDILTKVGAVTKTTKETLYTEAFKISDHFINSEVNEWKGELKIFNKPYSFVLSSALLKNTVLEKENSIKENKTNLQLVIPYNDINNLFSLLNNRKLSIPFFREELDEAFGKEDAEKLFLFLNLGEKLSPKENNNQHTKFIPIKGLNPFDVLEDNQPSSVLDHLIEGKIKPIKEVTAPIKNPNRKWVVFAGLFILILTAVFAIPKFISPPVNCNQPLLLEMVKGNTHQVKRMVLACANYRNPEQQEITINNHHYNSPIILAIANGDLETLKFLHEKGEIPLEIQEKNIENPSKKGWSAPWTAVALNQPQILDYLISKKINLDTRQEKNGETPLIHAVSLNNKYLLNKLLQGGADPDFSDSKGITPLLYALALDLSDIAKILLTNGASVPPFLNKAEFYARIKSANMKSVIQQYAPNKFSFLDAFQGNSPFNKNINGSYINEEEHLVFNSSLFRIYPFNISPSSNYNFKCMIRPPSIEDSGEFGVIFSSLANEKWGLFINIKGEWYLKNNKNVVKSGLIPQKTAPIILKIKKEKNKFEFKIAEETILTYTLDNIPGNFFGFQVENNFQGSHWAVEKYKLTTF